MRNSEAVPTRAKRTSFDVSYALLEGSRIFRGRAIRHVLEFCNLAATGWGGVGGDRMVVGRRECG